MALIKCPECGETVSSEARTCPHCGTTINNQSNETNQQRVVRATNAKGNVLSNNDEEYEESFFEKYKIPIIIGIVLVLGVIGFFVFRGNKTSQGPAEDTVDTAAVDTITVDSKAISQVDDNKCIANIKDFFNQYCRIFEDNDDDSYKSLCSDFLTKNYETEFIKNAGYNWRGKKVYCDKCEDYEKTDPLHFIHPHVSPSYPDDIRIKSVVKESSNKFIAITEGLFMGDVDPTDYEKYRVTVVEEDGDYLISGIERYDNETHHYYDLAKIGNGKSSAGKNNNEALKPYIGSWTYASHTETTDGTHLVTIDLQIKSDGSGEYAVTDRGIDGLLRHVILRSDFDDAMIYGDELWLCKGGKTMNQTPKFKLKNSIIYTFEGVPFEKRN